MDIDDRFIFLHFTFQYTIRKEVTVFIRAGRPRTVFRAHFVSHYNCVRHMDHFAVNERGRLDLTPGTRRRTPHDPILYYREHHQPMPTNGFLKIVSDTEPPIQEKPVGIFEHFCDPMPLDDFGQQGGGKNLSWKSSLRPHSWRSGSLHG